MNVIMPVVLSAIHLPVVEVCPAVVGCSINEAVAPFAFAQQADAPGLIDALMVEQAQKIIKAQHRCVINGNQEIA